MHTTCTRTNARTCVRTRKLARAPVRRTRAHAQTQARSAGTRAHRHKHSRARTLQQTLAAGNGLGEAGARLIAQQIGNTDVETMQLQYNHFGTVPLTITLDRLPPGRL